MSEENKQQNPTNQNQNFQPQTNFISPNLQQAVTQQPPQVQNTQNSQLKVKKTPPGTNKKLIIGLILGLFSFFVLAFLVLFFLINQSTDAASNPFIQIFGINPEDWIPFLINLTSAAFGFMVFVSFIIAIIGIFKIAMSKKDDKQAKLKGGMMTGIGAILFVVLVISWMFVYLNLSSRKTSTVNPQNFILTVPEQTVDLTAPLEISFDASNVAKVVNPARYQILSYEWNFGDNGDSGTGQKITHLYKEKGPNAGRYKVTLTVTYKDLKDGSEKQDKFERDVVFSNQVADTSFTINPESGPAPLIVTFDASSSADADGTIAKYEWDLDEDGFFDDAEGENVKYTYEKIGTFTAKLRVTDNNDNYSFAEKQITIKAGENPQAVITINSDNGQFEKGKSYLFDAGKSASPVDAQIVKYLWDFGDGSVANTRTANHSFVNVGKFTVKLTVTDENGLKGDDSSDVTIIEPKSAPIAVIMPTPGFTDKEQTYIEGEAPLSVTFSGLNSRDKDKDIIEYKWDFDGDGVTDDSGDVVKNIFKEQGEYQVTLTVIDSEKNESKASIIVKVKAHGIEAVLTASPIEGEVPLKVNFDASGSSFPEGKIISYEWDFGNGTKRIDISQISYTYNAVGTYTAKVTAVGSDGSKSEANVVVSIRPVSLKACFNMTPSIGDAPLDVQFDASCAGGTVAYYLWNFGNGKTSRDRKPIATYSKPGNYEITLEVRDQNGITDSTTKNVVVTGVVE